MMHYSIESCSILITQLQGLVTTYRKVFIWCTTLVTWAHHLAADRSSQPLVCCVSYLSGTGPVCLMISRQSQAASRSSQLIGKNLLRLPLRNTRSDSSQALPRQVFAPCGNCYLKILADTGTACSSLVRLPLRLQRNLVSIVLCGARSIPNRKSEAIVLESSKGSAYDSCMQKQEVLGLQLESSELVCLVFCRKQHVHSSLAQQPAGGEKAS